MKYPNAVFLMVCIALLCSAYPGYGQSYTLTGQVLKAGPEGSPLEGANVQHPLLNRGAATDANGVFVIEELPPGRHLLRITFVGYLSMDTLVTVPQEHPLVVRLLLAPTELGEILVEEKQPVSDMANQTPVGTINVSALPTREMPHLLGEPDLIRTIQTLPGVKVESDFTGGFYVRGGRGDQNLILLDGTPIYNPWHLFGLFSTFNTETVGRVEFNKGVFPARYGSRLSSVLDVAMQDGETRGGAGDISISVVSAQGAYGTVLNKKTSLLMGLRRTYLDPFFWLSDQALSSPSEAFVTRYNFMDANIKLLHRLDQRHQLEANFFWNTDRLRREEQYSSQGRVENEFKGVLGWENVTGMLRLQSYLSRWVISQQLYLVRYGATHYFDDRFYSSSQGQSPKPSSSFGSRFDQDFLDAGYRVDVGYTWNDQLSFQTGVDFVRHRFEDQVTREEIIHVPNAPEQELPLFRRDSLQTNTVEGAFYATLNAHLGWFSVYPGLRVQHFATGQHTTVSPRINLVARPAPKVAVSVGYGQFVQYLHVLGNEQATLPTNRWFWANEGIKPSQAETITLGAAYEFGEQQSVRIEGYYRTFQHLRDYSPLEVFHAVNNSDLPLFSTRTVEGQGTAYGVEGFLQKNMGRFAGWISYTLAWNKNQFDALNGGRPFFTRTDRRHDLQVSWRYALTTKWNVSMHFVYQSGQPMTLPLQAYSYEADPLEVGADVVADPLVVVRKNNFTLPAYHRLDLAVSRKVMRFWGLPGTLSLSVFNLYNRRNVLSINTNTLVEIQHENLVRVTPKNKYVSQLPIIPLLSLRVRLSGDEA